jgi:transposase-like protein
MARPYSYDLRQKAVEAVLNGAKLVEVSELFGIIAKQGNFVVTKYPKNQGGAVPCDPDLGQPLCVWL